MKTGKRKFGLLKISASLAASLFTIVALFLFFLTISPGEKIIKGILETQLTEYFLQPVNIEEFETNLLSRVRLKDISIMEADNNRPVITFTEPVSYTHLRAHET